MKLQPHRHTFKYAFIFLTLSVCSACSGIAHFKQPATDPGFQQFLAKFEQTTLPYTADIGFRTVTEITEPDEADTASRADTIEYEVAEGFSEDSLLSYTEAQRLFFTPNNTVCYWADIVVKDTEEYAIYAGNRFLLSNGYIGIVYGFTYLTSNQNCEKYLCIYSPAGELIAKLEVASGSFSGTWVADNGMRFPWYTRGSALISDSSY